VRRVFRAVFVEVIGEESMALRVLLVGLVASMGFELPTGQDLSSWARTGRGWADARMAELSWLRLEAEKAIAIATDGVRDELPPSRSAEVASTRADLIFEAAVEGMASGFAADLALMEDASPAEESVVAEVGPTRADLIFEATVEGMASEFAADLALMEDASPAEETVVVVERFQEMPPAESTEPEPEGPAIEAPSDVLAPAAASALSARPASRVERLSAAVRLTKQAVSAWASLIQPAPVKVADDGQGNSF
jgi:hypothetical protein